MKATVQQLLAELTEANESMTSLELQAAKHKANADALHSQNQVCVLNCSSAFNKHHVRVVFTSFSSVAHV